HVGVDGDRAGVDDADDLVFVEIDDRDQPLDRPAPDVLRAGGIEAADAEEATPRRARVAWRAGRHRRAEQLRRIDCRIAARFHRSLPLGSVAPVLLPPAPTRP